jgi:hypothetical protein
MLSLKRRRGCWLLAASLFVVTALVLAALAGCAQGAEQVQGEELPSQTEGCVLTVNGAEDGVSYEADVYEYTKAVAAADLNGTISEYEPAGTGTGTADNGTLEIDLETPDGEPFTADGAFLVVLRNTKDDSAPLKYKSAVPFTGGSAALKYSTMKPAAAEPDVPSEPDVPNYTVNFHTNGGLPADFTQEVQSGGKAAIVHTHDL